MKRVYVPKHNLDEDRRTSISKEYSNRRFVLNIKAKRCNYDPEELRLSYEEIENIPCVTDKKYTKYTKVNDQWTTERNSNGKR